MARTSGAKGGGFKARWLLGALLAALAACGIAPDARTQPAKPAPRPLFVGFFDAWDQSSRAALPERLPKMDVFAPLWITVRGPQAEVVVEPDDGVDDQLAKSRPRPKVFPLVSNAHDNEWDLKAAEAVILDPAAQAAFAARLADIARTRGFSGYILDFENLSPAAAAAYPAALAALRKSLAPGHVEVWVTASLGGDQPLAPFADAADALVVMAYDACWASSTPGPIAGRDWLEQALAHRLQGVEGRRVIIALASYGYDWPAGAVGKPISVADAVALAASKGATIRREPPPDNPNFSYLAADGVRHEVWFLDAGTFAEQRQLASAFRPRGYALWRLGLEDAAIWSLPTAPAPARATPPAPSAAPLPHPCDPLSLVPAR
jgi:peptidoglycan-N-acetylglucosamine deacetylase